MVKYNPSISILMATYNGERYLSDQIESIRKQTYKNWILYICDDGSNDKTNEIINSYSKIDDRIKIYYKKGKEKGAKNTFLEMLKYIDSDFYCFSDQDDVWLPNKIEECINIICSYVQNIPIIVHSDLTIVDHKLNVLNESFFKSSKIFPHILNNNNYIGICNFVTGCTMLFNKKVKEIAFPENPYIDMHDWWLSFQTLSHKGLILSIFSPLVLYRQHHNNVVGAQKVNLKYFIRKILLFYNTFNQHKKQMSFLKSVHWGSWLKFYKYKIKYQFKRNYYVKKNSKYI